MLLGGGIAPKILSHLTPETFLPPFLAKGRMRVLLERVPVNVILAQNLMQEHFPEKHAELAFEDYTPGDKHVPFRLLGTYKGSELEGILP